MEKMIEPFTELRWKWGDKLSGLGWSKSRTGYENKDLFKRRFYMDVGIMWRAHSGQPGITSGTFEGCGITSGGGF